MLSRLSLSLFAVSCIFSGCASPALYDYGKYSQRQYHMHKLRTDEAIANYEQELLNVMETSARKSKRVPPGIFAEYGYLQALKGNLSSAQEYFDRERATYPESARYIQFLEEQIAQNAATPVETAVSTSDDHPL